MKDENSFDNLNELKKYFRANYEVTDGISRNSTNIQGATQRRANNVTKIKARQVANKLEHNIRSACSAPPFNLHGIFDQLKINTLENGVIVVTIPFTERAYKESKFESDRHYSFMPILIDKGWTTKFAKNKNFASVSSPTLAYFVGTGELTRIINSFNKAYAPHGYRATLEYDEGMLGWIPDQYIKSL